MGLSRREEEKVKQALTETLTNLCKTSLTYGSQLCIEGLLGITLDETDVVLVKIDETLRTEKRNSSRNFKNYMQTTESEPSAKRGRPKKGRTRGRGRQATSRKRAHSPEAQVSRQEHRMPKIAQKFVIYASKFKFYTSGCSGVDFISKRSCRSFTLVCHVYSDDIKILAFVESSRVR